MSVTVKQIQKLDKIAIEKYGIPSLVLMENAGRHVAMEVLRLLKKQRKVCVVCGMGNNAGDGFVVARHLMNHGCAVDIVVIGDARNLKHDAAINYLILKKLKYPMITVRARYSALVRAIRKSDIVVDAIFGVGLNRDIENPYKNVIEVINAHAKRTVAIDAPSGLNADDGSIYGVCIKAHTTVTFTLAKKGFQKKDGPRYVGNVIVVDIGIPKKLYKLCLSPTKI